ARSVRQTLKVLRGVFPFRSCLQRIPRADYRACLEYHMGRCVGPCIGAVSKEEYDNVIKRVILFLEGKQEKVIKELDGKMEKAAEALDFEKAAQLRDQIEAIKKVIEGQRIAATVKGEQDAIAFAQNKDQAYVQVFFVRGGKLIGRENFVLQGITSEEPKEIMTDFLKQFYSSSTYVPPLILLQHPVEGKTVIEEWLRGKRGAEVRIQVPQRGNKKQLVEIVAANAEQGLQLLKLKQQPGMSELTAAMTEIQKELRLPNVPSRMECYDISNIQGKLAVGSMVVFEDGKPKPAHYRRFRIKTVLGADDYAMLGEVLRRRFKRGAETATGAWAIIPDLVLIDGGKGQLSAALSAMQESGAESVPVASLAKENEEIFIPRQAEPVVLPRNSTGLQLLQRLRDEAHRFAIGYHRKIRRRESFASALDDIPGVGPKRKRALLKRFGSVQAIRDAPIEEITTTEGMTRGAAKKLKEYL
ncbi:MAG: excinuclease ABC subunit UvrC, partial [Chloroflexi bacterium]|nr:excinuclease ABC subunit UvrC [Chloroflexota bacterium]